MIRTLLLTGTHNHDWRRSAPFCKRLLEGSGKFSVELTEDPAAALADPDALRAYQLFFVDYNGPAWPERARSNFLAAVAGGAGVCVMHAANNLTDWPEYEALVGLLWRDSTGHGPYHEFAVAIVDHDHPVTRGMTDFVLWDELYHRLENPQNVPYRVLAAAYDDPANGGSGRYEPVMLALEYGQGRVYHCVLGHVWPGVLNGSIEGGTMRAFENPGFQRQLLRGCEWAATGDVAEPARTPAGERQVVCGN